MSDDPRDAYRDDVLALVIVSEAGADTLRAAAAGEDIRTPAFRSETGPVILLFGDPDEDVREDLPGVAVIYDFEPLPAVAEWLAGSEGAPLAHLPRAFLIDAAEAVGTDEALPLAGSPKGSPDMTPTAPPASLHSRGERRERQEAAVITLSEPPAPAQTDDRSGQGGEPEVPPPVAPVDLPAEPTAGSGISWRLQAGRLVVTRAPIDPAAVPTQQQAEAAAVLLRVLDGRASTSLDSWRAACRDAWQGTMRPGSIPKAFARCRDMLVARGAIRPDGDQVVVVDQPPAALAGRLRRLFRRT